MDATLSSGLDARRFGVRRGGRRAPRVGDSGLRQCGRRLVVFPVFAMGPDLGFLAGIGQPGTLERGQMPSRAVPVYNALHRIWGPLALGIVDAAGFVAPVLLVGALVWGFHIFFDRAIGYGLRTRDGFQRS